MSRRSFERAVRKNSKQLNQQRKKSGQSVVGNPGENIYKGRSLLFPIFLIGLAFLYLFMSTFLVQAPMTTWDWVTMLLYVLLAVIFMLRRPYIKISSNRIITTKGNRERSIGVDDIIKFRFEPGTVVIEHNSRGKRWVFTKLLNRYDTEAITERLMQFAKAHQITVETIDK
ncbi:hypothetical protein PAECIP112173_01556 [Paenibacillus sp. JJ-100]|uniref:hypothetical protein n=1 Tax=Paenibacillus sp. JJ-100 TaxID=2974896 RepID=UPI0022FF564B|nr:hypothetical protein [Paenibacillus sp. JJ-100]CAI6055264.1 hypothetical protein PAECIP112173_01556 [Paenibacillus sp. JJ-100]